jgi:hypothetical protein
MVVAPEPWVPESLRMRTAAGVVGNAFGAGGIGAIEAADGRAKGKGVSALWVVWLSWPSSLAG